MKKIIYLLLFTLINFNFYSQSIKVTYSIRVQEDVINDSPVKVKEMMKTIIEEANTQKFNLTIVKKASSFLYQNQQLSSHDEKMVAIAKSAFGSPNSIFINFEGDRILEKTDDNILIESKASKLNWKVTNESKKINGYLCYKATLDVNPVNKVHNVVAWFCPSLPYSNGPKFYYGLPGLILELKEYVTTYQATKIDLNNKDAKVAFPKGKTISREEYNKRLKAQMGR